MVSPMIFIKEAVSRAEVNLKTGMRFFKAFLQARSSSYVSLLCFWPGTSQSSLKAVRHLLGHKSPRGMASTESIEFLIFEKVGRCLCNYAGEGPWQLALFTLNRIHAWRPLHSVEALLLREH